ncbi:hypothetical protein [Amycolatopsis sp. NPDC004378]
MIKTALARLVTARLAVAAAAATVVTAGGVAAVAATGNLPGSPDDHSVTGPATTAPSTKLSVSTTEMAAPSHGDAKSSSAVPRGTPSPSQVGLCDAYVAGAGTEHGKALESPAFTFLITTAGGTDKVGAYCANIRADADYGSSHNEVNPPDAGNHGTPSHPTGGKGDDHRNVPIVTKPAHH